MQGSIVDVIGRQRQRVDALARVAGRFLDDPARAALERISGRLARMAATLSTPTARAAVGEGRLEGQLERLVRQVETLRADDPTGVARVAWVLAEIEESVRRPTPAGGAAAMMPVYTAN
ncbi:MAG TPA: hypothetical protein VF796_12000 [Humisphaera sp.]